MRCNSILIVGFITLCLISCDNKTQKVKNKEAFIMYQPSELTVLMEEFYSLNEAIKVQIMAGDIPVAFPNKLLNIHTAEMSSNFSRDENFKKQAAIFVENQQAISNSSKETLKNNFNNTIHSCVACHQTSCTGPIPRIKKLLIPIH